MTTDLQGAFALDDVFVHHGAEMTTMFRMRRGRKVRLFMADRNHEELGVYLRRKRLGGGFSTPVFRVGRRLVYGYECFWTPLTKRPK